MINAPPHECTRRPGPKGTGTPVFWDAKRPESSGQYQPGTVRQRTHLLR